MNRFKEIIGIIKHKKAFMEVRNSNIFLTENISFMRAIMHDTIKIFTTLIFGDKIATQLHRRFAGHHKGVNMNFEQKVEAFCDWECARFTKPEKPLNGEETWKQYYPDVDMESIVLLFNLLK